MAATMHGNGECKPQITLTFCLGVDFGLMPATQKRFCRVYGNGKLRFIYVRLCDVGGGSTLGSGGGAQPPPKSWLGPKFSRTLDTLWSVDSKKK